MQTDLFAFHGYTELFLDGGWVKATPAFNAALCERFDVAPLEFDGRSDAVLQECDRRGNRYMEYVRDHGQFADLPIDRMLAAFEEHYPALMAGGAYDLNGSFEADAAADRAGDV
jgi:transglutaminase-like putative cysteine protease